jgi:hypothetical protein
VKQLLLERSENALLRPDSADPASRDVLVITYRHKP